MIVQVPGAGDHAFVIGQLEHTRMAGRFAAAWGNDEFASFEPRELVQYTVDHHDEGWDIVDARIGRDADTGLPYNLVRTPVPELVKSGARGPTLNERRHPYCGLLSSMHTVGLYTGRYGMSDKVFVDMVAPEHRPAVDDLLATERGRQDRLRAHLAAAPETARWAAEDALFTNYKLLQFFDTLALYFNCTPPSRRGRATFPNVPRAAGDDVTIRIEPTAAGRYRVAPYPFATAELTVACSGKRLAPQPEGTDMAAALAAAPGDTEVIVLEAA